MANALNSPGEGGERSEGDVNWSEHRRIWQETQIDRETRALLDEDERYFLHQSLLTDR